MSARTRKVPVVVRDALVAAALFAVVLAPIVADIGPDVLESPGYVLYVPLLLLYAATGGELEGANEPSILFVAAYVLAIGLLTAGAAGLIRRHFDVSGLATARFLLAGPLAIVGALGALAGIGALGGLLHVGTTVAVGLLAGGVVLVAAALVLATAAGDG